MEVKELRISIPLRSPIQLLGNRDRVGQGTEKLKSIPQPECYPIGASDKNVFVMGPFLYNSNRDHGSNIRPNTPSAVDRY